MAKDKKHPSQTTRENDDAMYNRGPRCSEPGCSNPALYHTPGYYSALFCGSHSDRAGYGRGDSMG